MSSTTRDEIRTGKADAELLPWFLETEGCLSVVDPDGAEVSRTPWVGNAFGNDGKAEALNVLWRGSARTGTYHVGLATNASGSLTDATVMTAITEPGSGYARLPLTDGSWSAPTDPGDGNRQISYPQMTFGPAGVQWLVKYVFVTTALTGTAGLFILYLPLVATVESGQSLLFTLRNKTRSS